MYIKQLKIFFLIIFIIIFSVTVSTSEENNQTSDQETVTITPDKELKKALVFGSINNNQVINPKSVSLKKLMNNDEDYKLALKFKKDGSMAKYITYKKLAESKVQNIIQDFATENEIKVIFNESELYNFLKDKPDYKNMTLVDFRKKFDISEAIIEAEKNKSTKEEEKGLLEKLFSD